MTRFTVVWRQSASAKLARIWLGTTDRKAVTIAADEIDRLLRDDPAGCGLKVSERLFEWIYPPLVILYMVSDSDCLVTVIDVDCVV